MAAGVLPKPGTELGPCVGECHHVDCGITRKIANSECVHCGQAIGYDTRFYQVGTSDDFQHASCAEDRAEWRASYASAVTAFEQHIKDCPCEQVCTCQFTFRCSTCGSKVTARGETFDGSIPEFLHRQCGDCQGKEAMGNTAVCPECESTNVSARDEADGWIDCFDCGLFFDPKHPNNGVQSVEKVHA